MSDNNKPTDKFWKLYIYIIIGVLFVVTALISILVYNYSSGFKGQDGIIEPEAQIAEFPFVETPKIYEDVLTYGWDNWSWNSNVNFSASTTLNASTTTLAQFNKSISVDFLGSSSGFMIHAPHFDTKKNRTLHLSVFTQDLASSTLNIELTDVGGNVLGTQLLSWYANNKVILHDTWYEIAIPLNNLNAIKKIVGGISITSSTAGTLYIDNIFFGNEDLTSEAWVAPIENPVIAEDIAPISLVGTSGSSTPYVNDFLLNVGNWRALSGNMKRTYGRLDLTSSTTNKIASYLLRGGELWKDYKFSISVNWAQADSISLLSRYYDSSNYFSCSFFDDGVNVTLYQVIGGKQKEITSFPQVGAERIYLWNNVENLAMAVKDNEVSCMSDGKTKIKYKVPYPISGIGGVGIEMWSPDSDSILSISKVIVEALP